MVKTILRLLLLLLVARIGGVPLTRRFAHHQRVLVRYCASPPCRMQRARFEAAEVSRSGLLIAAFVRASSFESDRVRGPWFLPSLHVFHPPARLRC